MQPTHDKPGDLARIRDNQRRSRARRAEHLRSIEARLRGCEDAGVAASAEMQQAARRVVRENRRLRALLEGLGVVVGEEGEEQLGGGDVGWPAGGPSDDVRALEKLLRLGGRRCGGGGGALVGGGDGEVRRLGWDSTVGAVGGAYESGFKRGGGENVTTPVGEQLPPPQQQQPQLHRQPPLQPRRLRPATIAPATTTRPSQQQQAPPLYAPPAPRQRTASPPPHQQLLHPRPTPPPAPPGSPPVQNQAVGTNSCVYATELITAMAGDAYPSDVRIDLGCEPQSGAGDCEVDNQVVFDLMDRYSGFGRRAELD